MLVIDPAARRVQIHAAREAITEAMADAARTGRAALAHDLAMAAVDAVDAARAGVLIEERAAPAPRSAVLAAARKVNTALPWRLHGAVAGPVAGAVMLLAAVAMIVFPYNGDPRTIDVFTIALTFFTTAALAVARAAWRTAAHATIVAVARYMTALYLEVNPPLRVNRLTRPIPAAGASSEPTTAMPKEANP